VISKNVVALSLYNLERVGRGYAPLTYGEIEDGAREWLDTLEDIYEHGNWNDTVLAYIGHQRYCLSMWCGPDEDDLGEPDEAYKIPAGYQMPEDAHLEMAYEDRYSFDTDMEF
jgi:hypothetical protein